MRVLVGGAVIGACLIAIPPAVEPDVEHHAVELTAAGDIIDLASPFTAMVDGLGGAGTLDGQLPELASAVSVDAGLADADPLSDFWLLIVNYVGLAELFGLFIFGGLWVNVAQFFLDAYNWVAGIFGLDPSSAMESVGTTMPDIDAAGADPALATELSTVLGDITSLFSGTAGPSEFADLIGDLGTGFDFSAIADTTPVFDDAGLADIGALVSSLIS
ncbi:hypothetical protein [Mycobacterium sp. pW045]|uniref:hypothetical protein n=1 Tax=Mycobacterium sp. pW045 TaxID=3238984 RepID=UPI00351B61D2